MKKITCDWCRKEANNLREFEEEYAWYSDKDELWDLCEECDQIYDAISSDMRELRETLWDKARKDIETRIKKETLKRINKIRK